MVMILFYMMRLKKIKKYKKNIINFNGWRTFIKIDKILTANKEL